LFIIIVPFVVRQATYNIITDKSNYNHYII